MASEAIAQFIGAAEQLLSDMTDQANSVVAVAERHENSAKLVFEIRDDENTEDTKIKEYQSWREQVLAKLEEAEKGIENYIRTEKLPETEDEDYDAEKLAAQYRELAGNIKSSTETIKMLNGGSLPETMNVPELKPFPGVRKANGNSGQSGIARPRFASVQYRAAGDSEWTKAEAKKANGEGTASNLTVLVNILKAKHKGSKLTAAELQSTIKDVTKGADLKSLAGQEIVFSVSVEEKNYEVQVIPQSA